MTISVTVITFNEEAVIGETLAALEWADEVVVVDSGSTDRTVDIASKFGALVIVHGFQGYGQQKNFAADQACNDWILNVDADEVVSEELRRAIQTTDRSLGAYSITRQNYFLGRKSKSMHKARSDRPVRFYNRNVARFSEPLVHERVEGCSWGHLHGTLRHYSFRDVFDVANKMNKYSTLLASERDRHDASLLRMLFRPLGHFLLSYFWNGAIMDGRRGFILSVLWTFHDFLLEAKSYEVGLSEGTRGGREG